MDFRAKKAAFFTFLGRVILCLSLVNGTLAVNGEATNFSVRPVASPCAAIIGLQAMAAVNPFYSWLPRYLASGRPVNQLIRLPEADNEVTVADRAFRSAELKADFEPAVPKPSRRRFFKILGAGAASAGAAAQENPQTAAIRQLVASQMRPFLSDLAAKLESSNNPTEKSAADYVREMADHFDTKVAFTPLNPSYPPAAVRISANGKSGYDVNANGRVDYVIAFNPIFLIDLLTLRAEGTDSEKRIAELGLTSVVVKEVGGLLFAQQNPYIAVSILVAKSFFKAYGLDRSDAVINNQRNQELIKIYTALLTANETAGYLLQADYLAVHDLNEDEIKAMPHYTKLSRITRETLLSSAAFKEQFASTSRNRQWESSLRHLVMVISLPHQVSEQTAPFLTAARLAGITIEPRPQHLPLLMYQGRPLGLNNFPQSLMPYLGDQNYYLVKPGQIYERLGLPKPTSLARAMGGVIVIGSGLTFFFHRRARLRAQAEAAIVATRLLNELPEKLRGKVSKAELAKAWLAGPKRLVVLLRSQVGLNPQQAQGVVRQSYSTAPGRSLTKRILIWIGVAVLAVMALALLVNSFGLIAGSFLSHGTGLPGGNITPATLTPLSASMGLAAPLLRYRRHLRNFAEAA